MVLWLWQIMVAILVLLWGCASYGCCNELCCCCCGVSAMLTDVVATDNSSLVSVVGLCDVAVVLNGAIAVFYL